MGSLQPISLYLGVLGVILGLMMFSLGLLKQPLGEVMSETASILSSTPASEVPPVQKVTSPTAAVKSEGRIKVEVDIERLQEQIDKLAHLSDDEPPSVTRVLFTEADMAGRRYVRAHMSVVGLEVFEDPIGNVYGRWVGTNPELPSVLTGSHTDAIPHAGKYDGVLGVLGAIEAVAALKRAGFVPKRTIEVLMFTSEEPTRFGYGCLGSRVMAQQEGFVEVLKKVVDKDGVSFAEAAAQAGHPDPFEHLDEVIIRPGRLSAFVELHIEQGPFLEQAGIPIGVVTAIAAPAALSVDFKGEGGHAGGVLMEYRNDAGLAAAELALAVERHVLATASRDTVGTTGKLQLHPGAVNSIPREAHLEIDIRDIDGPRRDAVVAAVKQSALEIAARRKVQLVNFTIVNADPPAHSSPKVVDAAAASASELGLQHQLMVSRAYHDSLFMARVAPMGMIFIPCYKGYSHRPDEFSSKQDIANGVSVLALTLAKLSLE